MTRNDDKIYDVIIPTSSTFMDSLSRPPSVGFWQGAKRDRRTSRNVVVADAASAANIDTCMQQQHTTFPGRYNTWHRACLEIYRLLESYFFYLDLNNCNLILIILLMRNKDWREEIDRRIERQTKRQT